MQVKKLFLLSLSLWGSFFVGQCAQERILVTGGAGFVGSHLVEQLLHQGHVVIVVDTKMHNLDQVKERDSLTRLRIYLTDICDQEKIKNIFEQEKPTIVCHLAACAGIRPSIEKPEAYVHTNVLGTVCVFEMVRQYGVKHVVLASSSSVYGQSSTVPFVETDAADRPCCQYAATKRAGELLAHTYCHLYGISCNCLRFFTVYGPRGRPDMVPFKFMDAMCRGNSIMQFGDGSALRDFTYVDDIVDGIIAAINYRAGFEIFNLGRGEPVDLKTFIKTIEAVVGKKATIVVKEVQAGDVSATHANIEKAARLLGYHPKVSLREGLERMFDWYKSTGDGYYLLFPLCS